MSGLPEIREQVSLAGYNTLAIPATARWFVAVHSIGELRAALALSQRNGWPLLLIGGGSNLILTGDHSGLCIHLAMRGIEILEEDESRVLLRVAAGEPWHPFVAHCLAQGWFGLENLALIPGTVGACPIQNIGAYGVEVGERLEAVEALDRETLEPVQFSREACEFGYRDSVFKRQGRDRYVITAVRFALLKRPALVLGYGALAEAASKAGEPTPQRVFEAVCRLREAKLPDPAAIPNAGSFFKNPVVEITHFRALQARYPAIVGYPEANGRIKLAAGWLIEQAGWKGVVDGAVGVHAHQALVLINPGRGRGAELLALAARIADSIQTQFGVSLEIEPRVY